MTPATWLRLAALAIALGVIVGVAAAILWAVDTASDRCDPPTRTTAAGVTTYRADPC